jgi:hypothetical protein
MKLTGTILRCSSRRVNASGSKETHVTNLLVLDSDNTAGANYAVEIWDEKPHKLAVGAEASLTITGVVSRNTSIPTFRGQPVQQEALVGA